MAQLKLDNYILISNISFGCFASVTYNFLCSTDQRGRVQSHLWGWEMLGKERENEDGKRRGQMGGYKTKEYKANCENDLMLTNVFDQLFAVVWLKIGLLSLKVNIAFLNEISSLNTIDSTLRSIFCRQNKHILPSTSQMIIVQASFL